jgi:anti-sigma B factor antagonist
MVEIKEEEVNGIFYIRINGDLDASSSIHLDTAIGSAIQNHHQKIIVDCSGLQYISSAGLGVFMSYIEEFEAKQIHLVLFGLSEKVRHVFQILGLDQLLKIVDTQEQANSLIDEL